MGTTIITILLHSYGIAGEVMFFKFNIPLFKSLLVVYVGDEEQERWIKATGRPTEEVVFVGSDGKCYGSYLWLKRPELKLLAHEMSHFVDNFIDHVGINDRSGEVRAYVYGWGMDAVWSKLNKCREVR